MDIPTELEDFLHLVEFAYNIFGLRGPHLGSDLLCNQQTLELLALSEMTYLHISKGSPKVVWGGDRTKFPHTEEEFIVVALKQT